MPPKSSADVASRAFTPDSVCSSALSFCGGAQPIRPVNKRTDAAAAAIRREDFIAEPSDGQEAAQWREGDGTASRH